jgi:acetoin utilization protein AcuC
MLLSTNPQLHSFEVPPTPRKQTGTAVFVGSEVYRQPAFGQHHPLSGPRVAAVMELCEKLGWLEPRDFINSEPASESTLQRFHSEDYIRALKQADECGQVSREARERYHIGTMENPLFPGLFKRAATTVGGSIKAAEVAMNGVVAFHPSGGTHHGRTNRASGFCYFNDPVFSIMTFLDQGLQRILYVDLDAHHGDGVQDAFCSDSRVMTLSIHEAERWPYSGPVSDRGHGYARNLPVPCRFNDQELDFIMKQAILPLTRQFAPQAMVITCGADGLKGDPLSSMALSNVGLWSAVLKLVDEVPRAVILGGGGYNPWTVARCWTGLWGLLSNRDLPGVLPGAAQDLLKSMECDLVDEEDIEPAWLNTLADEPHEGVVRPQIAELVNAVLQ